MMRPLLNRFRGLGRRSRGFVAAGLLLCVLFQAMIPAGFMPAANGSLALEVCHSGLMTTDGDGHHQSGHDHVTFCSFGATAGAAALQPAIGVPPALPPPASRAPELTLQPSYSRSERAHPARGPPVLS